MPFKFITIIFVSLLFSVSISAQNEARYLISSGEVLHDVRVRVISVDEESGEAIVRFSGAQCIYCDVDYILTDTSRLHTRDYNGSIDIAVLRDMTFASGAAEVFLADRTVKAIHYVDIQE